MPQFLVYILLFIALVAPIVGVVALRLLDDRLSERHIVSAAALLFGLAIFGVLALAFGNVGSLRVGSLTLLLPVTGTRAAPPVEVEVEDLVLPSPVAPDQTALPDATPVLTAIPAATATATATATAAATTTTATAAATTTTATPTATAVPPTATPVPPTATPVPPAAGPRTYTVQPGDTLRSIAEQFGVSVAALLEANDLTPEEADALRPGQELVIP